MRSQRKRGAMKNHMDGSCDAEIRHVGGERETLLGLNERKGEEGVAEEQRAALTHHVLRLSRFSLYLGTSRAPVTAVRDPSDIKPRAQKSSVRIHLGAQISAQNCFSNRYK